MLTTQVWVLAGNASITLTTHVQVLAGHSGASCNETPTQVMHVQVGRREVDGVRQQHARARATTTPT